MTAVSIDHNNHSGLKIIKTFNTARMINDSDLALDPNLALSMKAYRKEFCQIDPLRIRMVWLQSDCTFQAMDFSQPGFLLVNSLPLTE